MRKILRSCPEGLGFFTSTNDGATSYLPIMEPLLAAPIGNRFLIESRAVLLENFTPKGGGQDGYDHSHLVGLTYLQGDYILTPHITVVGGSFLTPFGTFNERLSPFWINNLPGRTADWRPGYDEYRDRPRRPVAGVRNLAAEILHRLRSVLFSRVRE